MLPYFQNIFILNVNICGIIIKQASKTHCLMGKIFGSFAEEMSWCHIIINEAPTFVNQKLFSCLRCSKSPA